MWNVFIFVYNLFAVPLTYLVFYTGSLFNKKMREGILGRKNYWIQAREIARTIPKEAKLILIHSSSVGEWEQAAPIVEYLKKTDPAVFILVTFFSPSGYRIVKNPNIDAKLYMPIDSCWNMRSFFNTFNPRVWIICKYDVWPNMLSQAKKHGVPVVLASAELAEDSSRHTFPMNMVNKIFYNKIDRILTISNDTRERFLKIYPYPERLIVSGDARYDQIYQKSVKILVESAITIFKQGSTMTFVAGSSWPSDEKHILPPLVRLCQKFDHLNIIIVPHEISDSHVRQIEAVFEQASIKTERYTRFVNNGGTLCRVAIIDTIGVLAKIYRSTQIAYVGGGFGSGVHNVMEPAAFAQPVLFGPRHRNSHEACRLVENLAAHAIHNENEFEIIVEYLIQKDGLRVDKGNDAKRFLVENLGGTKATIKVLEELGVMV